MNGRLRSQRSQYLSRINLEQGDLRILGRWRLSILHCLRFQLFVLLRSVALKLVLDHEDPAVRRYFCFMYVCSYFEERVQLQRSVGQHIGVSLADQKLALTQCPQISGAVTHPPFCGLNHLSIGKSQRHGLDDLVGIGTTRSSLSPHQPRLVEGEEQVLSIDEIERTKGFPRQHVERPWRPIS